MSVTDFGAAYVVQVLKKTSPEGRRFAGRSLFLRIAFYL